VGEVRDRAGRWHDEEVGVDQPLLVKAEWNGAVVDLYRSHRLGLLRLAVLLTDDRATAEDVVQDAFVALQRRWHAVDPAAAAGYLRTSVVNGARTLHRRRRVARRHLQSVVLEDAPPADLAVLLGDEQREVIEALRTLPRRQREVLVLRYWSELSEAEIAAALGVARGTVKSSASRALTALEKQLGDRHGR
jgi:RNA polymerase sigma-70 factor (sigma-E family)